MSIATTPTLLSLDRFAKIVGLTPIHFAGAITHTVFPMTQACDDLWGQYPYHTPEQFVSREEVAMEIAKAERDIKEVLGYSPAPDWEYREQARWPGGYSRAPKTFSLRYGKLIAPGVRGAALIEAGSEVIFSDNNGDGFSELATVVVATDLTDPREIKLFFGGHAGEPEWEIRPLQSVVIDEDAGTATIQADSWLFIHPMFWFELPTADEDDPIDISTPANYVAEVDVYRIFNDTSADGVRFLLNSPSSWATGFCNYCGYGTCPNCGATSQGGTFSVTDVNGSQVVPVPATYDSDSLLWQTQPFADCGIPRLAAFNYYAGEEDSRYLQGRSLDPLTEFWANTIAWMAAARLPRGVCGCDNVRERIAHAQRDLTRNTQSEAYSRSQRMDVYQSAFGTREGEVRAWQACTRIVGDQVIAGGGF